MIETREAPVGSKFRSWMVSLAEQISTERDAAGRLAEVHEGWIPLREHLTRCAFAAHQVLAQWDRLAEYRPFLAPLFRARAREAVLRVKGDPAARDLFALVCAPTKSKGGEG